VNYKNYQRSASRARTDTEGVSLDNIEKVNQDKSYIKCYTCKNYGQYDNECAEEFRLKKGNAKEGVIGLHVEHSDSYGDIDECAFLNIDLALVEPYEDRCGDATLFEVDRDYAFVNKVYVSDEYKFHQSKAHVNPGSSLTANQEWTFFLTRPC
jgi:hypothetical protein